MSIFSLIKSEKKETILILLLSTLQSTSSVVAAYFTAESMNYLIDFEFEGYFIYSLMTFLSISVGTTASYFLRVRKQKLIQDRSKYLRLKTTREAKDELNKNEYGFSFSKYTNMATTDIVNIENGLASYFDIFHNGILFIVSSISLLFIHYSLFFVTFLFSLLMIYAPKKFMNKISDRAIEASTMTERVQKNINNWLQGLDILRNFNASSLIDGVVSDDSDDLARVKVEQHKAQGQVYAISNTIHISLSTVVEIVAAYLAYIGVFGFGTIFAVGNLSAYLTNSLYTLNTLKTEYAPTEALLKKYSKNIDEDNKDIAGISRNIMINQGIALKNVSYEYPNGTKVDFPDMTFEKGQKYIIQGESGTGKSTLINILSGHLRSYNGRVTIDGKNMKDISIADLKRTIALVDQRTHIFNTNLKNNIILDAPYDAEKMNKILKESRLDGLVFTLPEGLETILDDNNIELSGGQMQRIILARAMYHQRELFIMDEGTSSLDKENAVFIEKTLTQNPDLTVIMITHNLYDEIASTVDTIYTL